MNDTSMLAIDELLEMKLRIDAELKSRAVEELAAIDQRKAQLLALVGNDPTPAKDELAERRTRKAGVAKYRNPANPDQTWTGRGKKPAWLTDNPDDCLIQQAA